MRWYVRNPLINKYFADYTPTSDLQEIIGFSKILANLGHVSFYFSYILIFVQVQDKYV